MIIRKIKERLYSERVLQHRNSKHNVKYDRTDIKHLYEYLYLIHQMSAAISVNANGLNSPSIRKRGSD